MNDYMKEAKRLADAIVREVAELPDRDSPADWPAAMLVTSDELRGIVLAHIQRGVPEGWSIRRDRGAIVVEHLKIGGYTATADSESIAATILYEFASAMLAAAPDHFRDAAKMMAALRGEMKP